jgi:hypothetical protein
MQESEFSAHSAHTPLKLGFLAIGSGTNTRSMYCSLLSDLPCGNSVGVLRTRSQVAAANLARQMSSFQFDYLVRLRLTGVNLNYFVIEEAALRKYVQQDVAPPAVFSLGLGSRNFAPVWLDSSAAGGSVSLSWQSKWAVTQAERLRLRVVLDAVSLAESGLGTDGGRHLLAGCDRPIGQIFGLDPKGFWRVDKDKDPELRHTVLTLVALQDLEAKIRATGSDRERGVEAFFSQNDGEGWMLPETIRLGDYGLGHDERAKDQQPVASRLGPGSMIGNSRRPPRNRGGSAPFTRGTWPFPASTAAMVSAHPHLPGALHLLNSLGF